MPEAPQTLREIALGALTDQLATDIKSGMSMYEQNIIAGEAPATAQAQFNNAIIGAKAAYDIGVPLVKAAIPDKP